MAGVERLPNAGTSGRIATFRQCEELLLLATRTLGDADGSRSMLHLQREAQTVTLAGTGQRVLTA